MTGRSVNEENNEEGGPGLVESGLSSGHGNFWEGDGRQQGEGEEVQRARAKTGLKQASTRVPSLTQGGA